MNNKCFEGTKCTSQEIKWCHLLNACSNEEPAKSFIPKLHCARVMRRNKFISTNQVHLNHINMSADPYILLSWAEAKSSESAHHTCLTQHHQKSIPNLVANQIRTSPNGRDHPWSKKLTLLTHDLKSANSARESPVLGTQWIRPNLPCYRAT